MKKSYYVKDRDDNNYPLLPQEYLFLWQTKTKIAPVNDKTHRVFHRSGCKEVNGKAFFFVVR